MSEREFEAKREPVRGIVRFTLLAGENTARLEQVSASVVHGSLAELFRLLESLVSFREPVLIGFRDAGHS